MGSLKSAEKKSRGDGSPGRRWSRDFRRRRRSPADDLGAMNGNFRAIGEKHRRGAPAEDRAEPRAVDFRAIDIGPVIRSLLDVPRRMLDVILQRSPTDRSVVRVIALDREELIRLRRGRERHADRSELYTNQR